MPKFTLKSKKNKESKKGGAFEFDAFDLDFPPEDDTGDIDDLNSEMMEDDYSDIDEPIIPKSKKRVDVADSFLDEELDDDLNLNNEEANLLDGNYNDYVILDDVEDEADEGPSYYSDIPNVKKSMVAKKLLKPQSKPRCDLEDIFEGYTLEDGVGDDVQLTAEEIDCFANIDFEKMAEILCKYDSATRMNIKENLLKKKLNILSMIHKGGSPDAQTTFFGLLSPQHVFHTLMCKKAISERNVELLVTIFTLKTNKFRDDVVETYEKIYQVSLFSEIDSIFKPMNELLICFIKLDKYFHEVKSSEYYKEAERTLKIITTKNISAFINFMVRFRPTSIRGICSEFYQRYGYSVVNFFSKFVEEDDIISMLSILHMSYLAPVVFYCRLLNQEIISAKASITLPYLLLDLRYRGLDTIMKKYETLYPKFNAKKVAHRFESDVRPFVCNILKDFE